MYGENFSFNLFQHLVLSLVDPAVQDHGPRHRHLFRIMKAIVVFGFQVSFSVGGLVSKTFLTASHSGHTSSSLFPRTLPDKPHRTHMEPRLRDDGRQGFGSGVREGKRVRW